MKYTRKFFKGKVICDKCNLLIKTDAGTIVGSSDLGLKKGDEVWVEMDIHELGRRIVSIQPFNKPANA